MRLWAWLLLLPLACLAGGASADAESWRGSLEISSIAGLVGPPRSGHVYKNLDPAYKRASYYERLHSLIVGGTWLVPESRVAPLPSARPDLDAFRVNGHEATVTWIGHATLLVQLDGVNFLTDPTWAGRSGPFGGLVGVGRYTPPAIPFDDLP